MKNKYLIGLLGFPLLCLVFYCLDLIAFGGVSVYMSERFFECAGLEGCENLFNFYCYQYNRSIYFISLLLSPFFVAFWYLSADQKKFRYDGSGVLLKAFRVVLLVLFLPTFLAFIPVTLGDAPSEKQLAILNLHRNPTVFTLSIYWFLFLEFMILGVSLKYVVLFNRRMNYANPN